MGVNVQEAVVHPAQIRGRSGIDPTRVAEQGLCYDEWMWGCLGIERISEEEWHKLYRASPHTTRLPPLHPPGQRI